MYEGKSHTLFAKYAVPQMIGLLFNSVYMIVDGVFIGNRLGRDAMAAAAVSVPLVEILQPFSKIQSIAVSSKPAHAVTGGDESECLNDHLRQKCSSSAANFPQNRLHLRPHHLNRVQIRTVWRQIEWNHTRRAQCLFYTLDVV